MYRVYAIIDININTKCAFLSLWTELSWKYLDMIYVIGWNISAFIFYEATCKKRSTHCIRICSKRKFSWRNEDTCLINWSITVWRGYVWILDKWCLSKERLLLSTKKDEWTNALQTAVQKASQKASFRLSKQKAY